jgi:hypothetical protein
MFEKLYVEITKKTNEDEKGVPPLNENIPSLYEPFKLPITYLPKEDIHPLQPTLSNDLELVNTINSEQPAIYDLLFQPKHEFAKSMIKEWAKQYTSNIDFLKDSQIVLINTNIQTATNPSSFQYNEIMEIWDSVKNDKYFLEKYSFIEWEMLKYLNTSTSFLQSLSIIHLLSPLMTLVMPILLILIPFFLLKLQGIPITINTYLIVLKDIAKSHFIGKALGTVCNKLDMTNIIYLLMICAFFVFQMYQNVISFFRFYNNIKLINTQLTTLRTYLKYSIHNMDSFNDVNSKYATYTHFCKDVAKHSNVLKELLEKVENITDFSLSISKFNSMGYMLKCYYELHTSPTFDESLRYSFGFEGYMDNLRGAYSHVLQSKINTTSYNNKKIFELKDQYYISHMNTNHVKNDCTIDNNIIITGVNASGKTTILKSITINILFSQQIGYGFYKKCKLHPYTHIHSYLNIPDTSGRDSLFQAESRRCKEMIDIIGECSESPSRARHFCILDELYSGTNPNDAIKASYAFLRYLCKYSNVNFMLTTHYTPICQKLEDSSGITNYKMDVKQEEDGKLIFNYKLIPGICTIQGAIEILKEMDYPKDIIETIQKYDNVDINIDTKVKSITEPNDECLP